MTTSEYAETVKKFLSFLPSGNYSNRTIKNYSDSLRYFSYYLAAANVETITPAAILGFRQYKFDAGASANSIRIYLTNINAFFNWCVKRKFISENPVLSGDIPDETDKKYTLLTAEEIEFLIFDKPKTFLSQKPIRNYAIVVLLLQSGLRSEELRSLRLCDLNFAENTIFVEHGKGDKKRHAPFPLQSQNAIKIYLSSGIRPDWCTDQDLLFGSDGDENGKSTGGKTWKQLNSVNLNAIVKRYVFSKTGKEIHTHTLRHAAASMWDDKGASIRDVQKALGHSSVDTTEKIYVRVLDKTKAAKTIADLCE